MPLVYDPSTGVTDALTPKDKELLDQFAHLFDGSNDKYRAPREDEPARYKLEVMFGKERSLVNPTSGMVSFWESGKMLHGGGDSKLYICPQKSRGEGTCHAWIPDSSHMPGGIVCGYCGSMWKGPELIGEIFARLTMQNWTKVLLKYFLRMDMNADIRIKYPVQVLHKVTEQETLRDRGGELLEKARTERVSVVYPLSRIIKDTSSGATLEDCIKKFLTS